MIFKKLLLIIFFVLFIFNCNEKTIYTGKIINQDSLDNFNINNKNQMIKELGSPSFIDPVENKYFYYSEKKIYKNFFDNKIINRTLLVFEFNLDETIEAINIYDLDDEKDITIVKDKTQNSLIKRGLIEKIFGGVGPAQQLPNTP